VVSVARLKLKGGHSDLEMGSGSRVIPSGRGQDNGDPPRSQQVHGDSSRPGQRNSSQDTAPEPKHPPRLIIIRPDNSSAPNVSLNLHNRTWRGELRTVAAFGTLLQLGVLVYSGFITCYPSSRFLTDGTVVKRYAFPLTAMGTITLVAGMLVCSYVVEHSMIEERYRPTYGFEAHVLWVQKKQNVSDQCFDSFAIISKDARSAITTSRRRSSQSHKGSDSEDEPNKDKDYHDLISQIAGEQSYNTSARADRQTKDKSLQGPDLPVDGESPKMLNGPDAPNKGGESAQADPTASEVPAVIGALTSVCGFVTQFAGLRGMHWSAAIMQLGATLVMTILRIWVRRGLAERPFVQRLPPTFELDWLAEKLEKMNSLGSEIWPKSSPLEGAKEDAMRFWAVDPRDGIVMGVEDVDENSALRTPSERTITRSLRIMEIRKRLGVLSKWPGPAVNEAISVASAIEVVANALLGSTRSDFTWSLTTVEGEKIDFKLTSPGGRNCVVDAAEIDAVLSLWLSAVHGRDESWRVARKEGGGRDSAAKSALTLKEDIWLRPKGASVERLRLLGPYSPALFRDLRWWVTSKANRILIATELVSHVDGNTSPALADTSNIAELEMENHSIVGYGGCAHRESAKQGKETRFITYKTCELQETFHPISGIALHLQQTPTLHW
jgi:hypothetical protein